MTLRVLADAEAVARAGADAVLAIARGAAGPAAVAISGGRTPLRMFELLAAEGGASWEHVHVFWADERCVPPGDAASNFRGAAERWLRPGNVPDANVHRIRGELRPGDAAADYESDVRAFFAGRGETKPLFDLVLLGMGADGHTASLFPGSAALDERDRWVAVSHAPAEPRDRVTLTFPGLASARRTVLLVTGADKRDVLARARAGDPAIPASRLVPAEWIVDESASIR